MRAKLRSTVDPELVAKIDVSTADYSVETRKEQQLPPEIPRYVLKWVFKKWMPKWWPIGSFVTEEVEFNAKAEFRVNGKTVKGETLGIGTLNEVGAPVGLFDLAEEGVKSATFG